MVSPKHRKNGTDVNYEQRVSLAIKLRASGMQYREIAQQCGFNDGGKAYTAIQTALKEVKLANIEELRDEEGVSLKMLYRECWDLAMDKENKQRLFAVDRCIALSERYSKLMGLDIQPNSAILNQNYTKEIVLLSGDIHDTGNNETQSIQ